MGVIIGVYEDILIDMMDKKKGSICVFFDPEGDDEEFDRQLREVLGNGDGDKSTKDS